MSEDRSTDIIREIINIGVGDAAAALSRLVDRRIVITVPEVRILEIAEVPEFVREEVPSLGVYISQEFRGMITGRTLLFYTRESSFVLLKALTGQDPVSSFLSQTDMATLQEVGNILMVSCMSTIGDMTEDGIRFEIPQVTEEISEAYFANLVAELNTYDKVIVVKNEITVQDVDISGYLFVLLGVKGFSLIEEALVKRLAP